MPMKSETIEEARERMKAMREDERTGAEAVAEGQLQPIRETDEMRQRAEQIDKVGEQLQAIQTESQNDGLATAVAARDDGSDTEKAARADNKAMASRGSAKNYQTK